ncbi:MAG TPA: hypothetical protein VFP93_03205, partial [Gammaproteobacteria bacterium]|nr:hypothetical protein [Gammaproteobacteria bacterium]
MFDGPKKTSRLDLEQAISNENLTNTTHEVIPPTRIDMFLEREVENKYLYKMCDLGDNPKYEVVSGHKVPAKK